MTSAGEPRAASPDAATEGDALPFRIDLSAIDSTSRITQATAALRATTPDDWGRRAELLSTLAVAQSLSEPSRVRDTIAQARHAAKRAGTQAAKIYTLMARYAIDLSPEELPRRTGLADEAMRLLALPDCADLRPDLLPLAYFMYLGTLMESGDTGALDAALSPELHLADPISQVLDTRYALWFRCARATMDGQLPLAEKLAHQGHALALARGDIDADYVRAGQIAIIRWMQGRISEMEPVFVQARRVDPAEPIWAASTAWIWSHQGRTAAARGLIGSLPDMNESPRGRNWLAAVAILAEVASDIGSDDLVERLHRTLLPFADRVVSAGLGIVCWGTAARPLALLARRQGRPDEARAYYRDAIAQCARIGAQAWLAQAQAELAALEFEHGNVSDARVLADESTAAASHLGLHAVAEQIKRWQNSLAALPFSATAPRKPAQSNPAQSNPRLPNPALPEPPFRATADLPDTHLPLPLTDAPRITVLGGFSVAPPGCAPIAWRSRKARTLLQILVARRGTPLPRESAMHLLWPDTDPDRLRNRLSVALTTIRRAFDPDRTNAPDTYLTADADMLRLRLDRLSVDIEDFLALSEAARTANTGQAARERILRNAVAAYRGEALAEEADALWAEPLRRQAQLAFLTCAHALATCAGAAGNHLEQTELYRRILRSDPYDRQAHDGLVTSLTALQATGHVAAARQERRRRLAELGLA